MNILIIGGKKFIGYHIALEAEKRGHTVTLFNRGTTNPQLLPQFKVIQGDRNGDLSMLEGLSFDAVIDNCAAFPHQVKSMCQAIGGNVKKYLLVSSLSACQLDKVGLNEDDPVCGLDFTSDTVTGETFGPLKAACEKQLVDMLSNKALIMRPGYICGQRDISDRFTYWPVKMHFHNEMLMPVHEHLNFQFIDVRDLAAFFIHSLEQDYSGIYTVTGPVQKYTFSQLVNQCRDEINPSCRFIKISDEQLKDEGLTKIGAFPLCVDTNVVGGMFTVDISKAVAAGLKTRPAEETFRAALDWYLSRNDKDDTSLIVGLKRDKELELINKLAMSKTGE